MENDNKRKSINQKMVTQITEGILASEAGLSGAFSLSELRLYSPGGSHEKTLEDALQEEVLNVTASYKELLSSQ